MKKQIILALSGGCYSGKTSVMKNIQANNPGLNVIVLPELMRSIKMLSIDDLRNNPGEYLKVQDEIVRRKMLYENDVANSHDFDIAVFDRAITDSLYYLVNHVDSRRLTYSESVIHNNLISDAQRHAIYAMEHIYTHLAFFLPIEAEFEESKFRPSNIHEVKYKESIFIQTTNEHCMSIANKRPAYKVFNLNVERMQNVLSWAML